MNETNDNLNSQVKAIGVRETGLIDLLIVFAQHKRKIVLIPLLVGVVAALIALVIPNVFRASAKLLPPQQAQSGASALLSQLGGMAGAAATAAGIKSPNDLYIGMLKSRTVADKLIQRFDLKTGYKTDSVEEARLMLESNTKIGSGKDGLITIAVEASDGKKAAQLANGYVEELATLTKVLAVTEAAKRRLFFERQLELSKDNLANAEIKLKGALDRNGVISVDSESRAIVETIGRVRAQISAKEIELSSMKAFVTVNNPEHLRVREELNSLRAELGKLQDGRPDDGSQEGAGKPAPAGLANIKLLRDVKYHQMLYELLAKQYEVARLDEAKDAAMIQVLDSAVEPEKKVAPARMLIVLAAVLASLICTIIWVLLLETRNRAMRSPVTAAQLAELKRHLLTT